jgi:hypothetical protein
MPSKSAIKLDMPEYEHLLRKAKDAKIRGVSMPSLFSLLARRSLSPWF